MLCCSHDVNIHTQSKHDIGVGSGVARILELRQTILRSTYNIKIIMAIEVAKVDIETRCGTVPNNGSQHEVEVRGITPRKQIEKHS